jgi:anti-sigma factor (TIGR02949 family)
MTKARETKGPDDIGCLEAIESLYAYLDGEIGDPESRAAFEEHLGHCRSCFSRLELERRLAEHARKAARSSAPEALRSRLKGLLEKI